MNERAFDFGQNWKDFSKNKKIAKKISDAEKEFFELFNDINIKGQRFLDIGFGQGFSLILSQIHGAKSYGVDINKKCEEALRYNEKQLNIKPPINVIIGSILNNHTIQDLNSKSGSNGFDIVHSWGVLHHTGEMWKAIETAQSLVNKGGYFVIAIYNKHWTSKTWVVIKRMFNSGNQFIKKLFLFAFLGILFPIKFVLNPMAYLRKKRGMSIYYDAIDWLGGYPYEYASKGEIQNFVEKFGFKLQKFNPTQGFTGCNEFVFRKIQI